MGTSEQFTRADLLRILSISDKQLGQWEKMQFVRALQPGGDDFYNFRDLISLRTTKQLLENGVSPDRLRRSLQSLAKKLSEIQAPLNELRIISNGKDVLVELANARLEPLTGQFILTFQTREIYDNIVAMPHRNVASLFDLALEYDADPNSRAKAAETYDQVIRLQPDHVEALVNRGMIAYEQGDLEAAADHFRRAIAIEPKHTIALFNLGSTLEEMGLLLEARQHLRLATRLDPEYADAHYNLALVCDKLQADAEAREHWIAYLKLDSRGVHADYARTRLA